MHITAAGIEGARKWDAMVYREHQQTDRFRDPPPDADPWTGLAWNFSPPDRDEKDLDPAVNVVETYLDPGDTVIDVGAGGGRLAIPLARRCARVVAVEPSPAMRARMDAAISELGVDNVEVVPERWQDADVPVGDHVICSHVMYATTPVLPFLEKLHDHANKRVTVMLRERPPQANFHELFERLFGEERIALPAMPEFRNLLESVGIKYDLHRLEDRPHGMFPNPEAALRRSIQRLFLNPGSASAKRLAEILPECLVPDGEGVRFSWAEPQRGWLVSWSTE
ncbi:MAG: class I SAM-dependent methyltransferase [Chloroflexi bacterium]|jgi:SAM-dependent methyltransferase|nr:class I SAM-dependent methyltransferase [Chloroflexota bacterium]MBT4074508.1 class I SAM-dependent methyltransferase [Chloroflexota bacterium]MBT4515947.1 class I SAM-dependent methyltransferase [Chloroflexota bacterium]MBT6682146.1 class I SAM-dependent methyltransferase [Chloroflexota bacterium]